MSTKAQHAIAILRDPDSDEKRFRNALEYWLELDRDADPFEELELQSRATGRLMEIKAEHVLAIEEVEDRLRGMRRRLAIASKQRDEWYDDQCHVALLEAVQRIEAKYAEAEKPPPRTRIDQEAKADPDYLQRKEMLRVTVLAAAVDEAAEAEEARLRLLHHQVGKLDALLRRLEGRYWACQQLARDKRQEAALSGQGAYA